MDNQDSMNDALVKDLIVNEYINRLIYGEPSTSGWRMHPEDRELEVRPSRHIDEILSKTATKSSEGGSNKPSSNDPYGVAAPTLMEFLRIEVLREMNGSAVCAQLYSPAANYFQFTMSGGQVVVLSKGRIKSLLRDHVADSECVEIPGGTSMLAVLRVPRKLLLDVSEPTP